jgi:hypothetical protein
MNESEIGNVEHLADVITKTRLEPNDIVIFRTANRSRAELEALITSLRTGAPQWRGALVILDADDDFDQLPELTRRELYEHLKREFA